MKAQFLNSTEHYVQEYTPSALDIIFKHKNKAYGAYVLRKEYDKHLLQSVSYTITAILSIILLRMIILNILPLQVITEISPIHQFTTPPKILIEKIIFEQPTQNPLPPKQTINAVAPVVKKDHTVRDSSTVATIDERLTRDPGSKTEEGTATTSPVGEVINNSTSTTGSGDVGTTNERKLFDFVEVMPKFPGGNAALYAYLSKHINYPKFARENGIQATVIMEFVVDVTGDIYAVRTIRESSAGFGVESARVVSQMPKWTPGMQNGNAVPVRIKIPIKFALE